MLVATAKDVLKEQVTKTEAASDVTLWQIARLAGAKVSVQQVTRS